MKPRKSKWHRKAQASLRKLRLRLWRAGLLPHPLPSGCHERISAWVAKEMAAWAGFDPNTAQAAAELDRLNRCSPEISIYRISGREVVQVPKPNGFFDRMIEERAGFYLRHLEAALQGSRRGVDASIAVFLGDGAFDDASIPVFSFQKPRGHRAILLPDVDFLWSEYYQSAKWDDPFPYSSKTNTASFVGATTGSGSVSGSAQIKAENARALDWPPRLKSFAHFRGNPRVSFQLPLIVHCDAPETEHILEQQGIGGGLMRSWPMQFAGRFIISMDGNGAACSRVVIALKSHCVLLKYDSDSILYYFHGLEPWKHYIPIASDAEVESVLDAEERGTSHAAIAEEGRKFANAMLNREAVLFYTCQLLEAYGRS
ncbi:MAG: glycosyl transferase family 90 [Pseudoxanthomonas sp.]